MSSLSNMQKKWSLFFDTKRICPFHFLTGRSAKGNKNGTGKESLNRVKFIMFKRGCRKMGKKLKVPWSTSKMAHLRSIDRLRTEVENWPAFTAKKIEEFCNARSFEGRKTSAPSVYTSDFYDGECVSYWHLCKLVWVQDLILTRVISVASHYLFSVKRFYFHQRS